jgi:hypothetical protein
MRLLQKFQNFLLHCVCLCQSTDTRLAQDLVLGQVRSSLAVVGGGDVVLRGNDVGLFRAFDGGSRIQRVDLRAELTALAGRKFDRYPAGRL